MNRVNVNSHIRKWPKAKMRYYFGVLDDKVTCFIQAKSMDEAFILFSKVASSCNIMDVRPMKELSMYLKFEEGVCVL